MFLLVFVCALTLAYDNQVIKEQVCDECRHNETENYDHKVHRGFFSRVDYAFLGGECDIVVDD